MNLLVFCRFVFFVLEWDALLVWGNGYLILNYFALVVFELAGLASFSSAVVDIVGVQLGGGAAEYVRNI